MESDPESIVETAKQRENEKAADPNVVDWDGPDDPENPLNWSTRQRYFHVALASIFTLYA